eukprot:tig00001388_g8576.t1
MAFTVVVPAVASSSAVFSTRSQTSQAAVSRQPRVARSVFEAKQQFVAGEAASFLPARSFKASSSPSTSFAFDIRCDNTERTFIAIKPDGVQRGKVGAIISRFEEKGYKLVGMKALIPSKALAEEHYAALKEKPFFNDLVSFITSGPVIGMVWEGKGVVATGRKLIGATNPLASEPGTIRGDFGVDVGRNVIHGSDSVENGQREINLWFKSEEVFNWTPSTTSWIYE